MKITIERKDLCTKEQVIKMLARNRLYSIKSEYEKGFNEAINQLIEVIERDL